MTNQLERYSSILMRMENEGDGYYFHSYASPSAFDFDAELKDAFIQASTATRSFIDLLYRRITDLGGEFEYYDEEEE